MRHPSILPVLSALAVSNMAFLPGLKRGDDSAGEGGLSRKAIPVLEVSLLESLKGGPVDLRSLLFRAGRTTGPRMGDGVEPLLPSLHGGSRDLGSRASKARGDLESWGNSAAPIVVGTGNLTLLGMLEECGIRRNGFNSRGESAVQVAVLEGRAALLRKLLDAGFPVSRKHPTGWNTLQLALQRGDPEVLRILLGHGADPRARGTNNRSSLDLALALDSPVEQIELLLKAGADPNEVGPDGRTAIDLLLAEGDFERAGALVRHGGRAGVALYNAVVEGDRATFRFLLEQGVKPERGVKDPILVAAVREGHAELVADLLQVSGSQDLSRRGREGQSAFHLALALNRLDLCRLLLEAGANPNDAFARPVTTEFLSRVRPIGYLKSHLKHDSRVTPLMAAADCGNLELASLLMAHGAKRFIWSGRKSYYPIGFAARRSDVKMMQLLLGVDPENEERLIKVDLSEQKIWVHDGEGAEVFASEVSTGKKGYRTRTGEFVITNKNRHHVSNIYKGVKMPYFQRFSCGAFGFHEGYCPGYPASHGCLRVPRGKAAELWEITKVGDRVVIVP